MNINNNKNNKDNNNSNNTFNNSNGNYKIYRNKDGIKLYIYTSERKRI